MGAPLPSREPLFTWAACVAGIGVSCVGREAGDEPLTVGRPVGDVGEEGTPCGSKDGSGFGLEIFACYTFK